MLKPPSLALTLVVIALLSLPASAQQGIPGGKWWQMPAVAQRLALSGQEIDQLDDAYRESRRHLIRLKADVQTEQLDLQHIIERRELDEARALDQYKKLDRARAELGLERFRFLLTVRKIVGHERFATLLRMREKHQQRMRRDSGRSPMPKQ